MKDKNDDNAKMENYESSVLAETMMYIEECLTPNMPSDVVPSVKLSDIKFYDSSMSRLVGRQSKVNTTRLKDKILRFRQQLASCPG